MFTLPSIAGLFAGAALGVLVARRRKGSGLDMAHWGAVFAILGLILGIAVSLLVPAV